jgi:hypothetical protein
MSADLSSDVESVFEQLLKDWNRAQKQLIDRWPRGQDRAMGLEDLERARLEWLERFQDARRLEGRIYEGNDSR